MWRDAISKINKYANSIVCSGRWETIASMFYMTGNLQNVIPGFGAYYSNAYT